MKKFLVGVSLLVSSLFGTSFAYEVVLPQATADVHTETSIDTNSSKDYYTNLAKLASTYLWFLVGVVSFIIVLYAGFLLVTSQGTPEDLKKANKMLVWGLIGIFTSLLAYLIVKVLINLF